MHLKKLHLIIKINSPQENWETHTCCSGLLKSINFFALGLPGTDAQIKGVSFAFHFKSHYLDN